MTSQSKGHITSSQTTSSSTTPPSVPKPTGCFERGSVAAVLGHTYPIYSRFRGGGKGVATALGVFLGISPLSILGALAVFAGVLYRWRYVSLASIAAAAVVPSMVAFFENTPPYTLMALLVAVLVIWRHRENIRRLREGTESRFKA